MVVDAAKPRADERYQRPVPVSDVAAAKRKLFLDTLRRTGRIVEAAQAVGYADTSAIRAYAKTDQDFARELEEAMLCGADILEDEAFRRAKSGVEEDVFYQGAAVGTVIKYSDGLLQFLLRGLRPDRYRESVRVDGSITGTFGVAVIPLSPPSQTEWEEQARQVHAWQKDIAGEIVDGKFETVELKRA